MNAIVPRDTVAMLVAKRDQTVLLYKEFHEKLMEAKEALRLAEQCLVNTAPLGSGLREFMSDHERRYAPSYEFSFPERDEYLAAMTRNLDIRVWSHLVKFTNLEMLMDKTSKEELRKSLATNPPEVNEGNVYATLERFLADSEMIWKRGVAECFSKLDRRFRSHTGWKIGSRIVLSYCMDENGYWSYSSRHRDTIIDIERAFAVLDGNRGQTHYSGICDAVDEARRGGWGARQTEVESEYFKLRAFRNGNVHLWFKRDDLLVAINRLLADYYGEVIPQDREPDVEDPLARPNRSVAKNFGFFPTPDSVAERVVEEARLFRYRDDPPLRVLEPSAGSGSLVRFAAENGAVVTAIEVQQHLVAELQASGRCERVIHADFFDITPDDIGLFDRIIMNPPFDSDRDVDHVAHAMKFLKPGGRLVAIMSAGTEFRSTRKAEAFRERMAALNAEWKDLPPGSFKESGTNVNTVIVSFWAKET